MIALNEINQNRTSVFSPMQIKKGSNLCVILSSRCVRQIHTIKRFGKTLFADVHSAELWEKPTSIHFTLSSIYSFSPLHFGCDVTLSNFDFVFIVGAVKFANNAAEKAEAVATPYKGMRDRINEQKSFNISST